MSTLQFLLGDSLRTKSYKCPFLSASTLQPSYSLTFPRSSLHYVFSSFLSQPKSCLYDLIIVVEEGEVPMSVDSRERLSLQRAKLHKSCGELWQLSL